LPRPKARPKARLPTELRHRRRPDLPRRFQVTELMIRPTTWLARALFALSTTACLAVSGAVSAAPVDPSQVKQRMEPLPKRLQGIDGTERVEQRLPSALSFVADDGRPVLFGELFDDGVRVIVTLNCSDCPMLCSLQLNALVEGLKQIDLTLGKDYRIVTVS